MRKGWEHLARAFDVRAGEGRVAIRGFAAILLLIITAHTILETVRDALLLTGPGPRALGIVYMAIAICALPAAALGARVGERFGAHCALAITLAVAATSALVMFVVPKSHLSAMALYVVSGVIASVVVPQFWVLVGMELTVAQGRRLFGLIASAGVVGGVLGSGAAAAAIHWLPTETLLLVSAGVFGAAAAVVLLRGSGRPEAGPAQRRPRVKASWREVRDGPFLARIALLVILSTATVLSIDYFFKWTVVRTMPSSAVAPFVARYYLALNVASLVVQLFLARLFVHRLGVIAAVVVTPSLLFLGLAGALVAGGALLPILLLKGIDGSLRHSIHRITGELVYLPVSSSARGRIKPLIDGALVRAVQTVTGATFLALATASWLSPRVFAAFVLALVTGWLFVAMTMRRPYLALLRHALATDSLITQESPDPIDLESAAILVHHLASEDPLQVIGAMRALSRRGREGLVPALVLLHADEAVLTQALEILSASSRTDWIPLGHRLLADPREALRIAAARALAMHEKLDVETLARDSAPRIRGYATLHLALRDSNDDAMTHPRVAALLQQKGPGSEEARLGLLAAVADAKPTPGLSSLLLALSTPTERSAEKTELLARAAARQHERRMIPRLIEWLAQRPGRESVRAALVTLGDEAFEAAWTALLDPSTPRSLRVHLPKSLARFGTTRAAECLLSSIETERDGHVRNKSIRALEVLVVGRRVPIRRIRVERQSHANLVEHFRILALRAACGPGEAAATEPAQSTAERLLVGLLDDKLHQSLERAFRLLKIAHPREDIRRVHLACVSREASARANAVEFLDTLLRRRDQQPIRELFRLIADDVSDDERISRAAALVPQGAHRTRNDAILELLQDADIMVSALASVCAQASTFQSGPIRDAIDQAHHGRPRIDLSAEDPFRELFRPTEAIDA